MNRAHEDGYDEGKLVCLKCGCRCPIDHFEPEQPRPPGLKPSKIDWFKAFYESEPYGLWEGFNGFGVPSTLEQLCDDWKAVGVVATPKDVRNAAARGRLVLGDPKRKRAWVVAHPWEYSMFCASCRKGNQP